MGEMGEMAVTEDMVVAVVAVEMGATVETGEMAVMVIN